VNTAPGVNTLVLDHQLNAKKINVLLPSLDTEDKLKLCDVYAYTTWRHRTYPIITTTLHAGVFPLLQHADLQ